MCVRPPVNLPPIFESFARNSIASGQRRNRKSSGPSHSRLRSTTRNTSMPWPASGVAGMFIDEWFGDNFYKKLALGYHNEANFCFGQIFWTQTYYPHENLELWRPVPDSNEPTRTTASLFRITAA